MPSRVVDIRGEKPRLLTNQFNKYGVYVALSYSWVDNGSNMLQLKKETQATLKGTQQVVPTIW